MGSRDDQSNLVPVSTPDLEGIDKEAKQEANLKAVDNSPIEGSIGYP